MNKAYAINKSKIKTNRLELYVQQYTLSRDQQQIISKQILGKIPTDLQFVERSIFMKRVTTRIIWSFDLRTQEEMNVPIRFSKGVSLKRQTEIIKLKQRYNLQTPNNKC